MKKINLKLWRDIGNQKWQFVALTLIILLGVTSYSAMIGMIDDVQQSIERTLDELRFHDFAVSLEGVGSERLVQKVAALDNVAAVNGRLVVDTGLYVSEDNQAHARLVGMPTGEQPPVNQVHIRDGRYLEEGDGAVAVLEHHFADHYGYGPGTVLHPIVGGETIDVEVVGVGVSPEYLMAVPSSENPMPVPGGFAVLFVPQAELQSLFGAAGAINELDVLLENGDSQSVERAIDQVKEVVGAEAVVRSTVRWEDNPSYNLLTLDLEGGREMMGIVPSMFLTVAALSIYVFLSRMVQAQRPQIGVFKALGYSRWAVMRHYLFFAGIVAVVGSAVGFALSYPLGMALSRAYAAQFGLPFVVAEFHLTAGVQAIGISLVFCLLAGFFPAWTSARMAPAQAFRFDPSIALVTGSVPLLERLLSPLVHLRTGTKIALRNIFRNRRRTLTTALGFIFAFVILLACWSLFDALDYMLEVQFRQTDRWDVHATFLEPQSAALLDQVSGWSGVETVEAVVEFPVTLQSETAREDAFLTALDPATILHGFRLPRGKTAAGALSAGKVLISAQLAQKLDVQTGDRVTVETVFGTVPLVADTGNEEVMSQGVYVGLPWVRQMAGSQDLFNGLLLEVDPAEQHEVRRALYELPGIASVVLKDDVLAGWEDLMGLYYVMMGSFLLFALIISGAVVLNTMTVNVLERTREIATMRALGQPRRRLTRMITLENVIVGLLSAVPGLAIGAGATWYLFGVFMAGADFYMPFYISPRSYLFVTGLIFLTALLSQIPAVRRVNRMDLAAATKVMT